LTNRQSENLNLESENKRRKIQHHFLTPSTAEGLRVTLSSTLDLCNDLLESGLFKYVLSAKFNQDRLEVYTNFWYIRHISLQNVDTVKVN